MNSNELYLYLLLKTRFRKLMATATLATAAGAAALLYYTLNKKLQSSPTTDNDDDECGSSGQDHALLGVNRVSNRLIQAPATWLETIATLSETLRFTYSETLGKWPIGDLAFGISFLLKQQVIMNHLICFFTSKGIRLLWKCYMQSYV